MNSSTTASAYLSTIGLDDSAAQEALHEESDRKCTNTIEHEPFHIFPPFDAFGIVKK